MTAAPAATPAIHRLSSFIRDNVEPILAEWETFARSLSTSGTMDVAALRDHAKDMLLVIASDLERPQTERAQHEKATSNPPADFVSAIQVATE